MRVFGRRRVAAAALVVVGCAMAACSSPAPSSAAAKAPEAPSPKLWGDMKPVVSVKELMRDMLDPASDFIFDAVKIVYTKAGAIETTPKTDADWDRIRIGAVSMAEAASLLKIPRPFAPAGDLNNSTGPDAVELSPEQIRAKVEKDPVEWNARIEALRNVGLQVMDIVDRKATQELWDASENLDAACEACHKSYWYPGETSDYYRRLDRRMREHNYPGGKTKDPEPEK